ncbi:hypothetical protein H0I29_15880 [Polaribacter sp. R2A056_3_33]|uniref:hypothetical protein n=1 Tax=Polaribacter sp. R2A056_3_33 TaxID=2745563 RepID=UPI001C4EF1AA|nr:hypothetical protein [Polaribacter sp. R2A056_3_33]QXP70075.1 hypothetical protein H0I29_15880 [Polaribacter sp. R2A056_3_33]
MIKAKTQSFVALLYFLIASSLGILLRLFPIIDINIDYKFFVHTHSHVALLGWVYIGLTSLLFYLYINEDAKKKYTTLFLCTQITIVGMLISFPITGYALFSIIFSTLFIICSYWFFAFFRKNNHLEKDSYALKFISTSLVFMIISSIGPWSLGIIMNTLGSTSHWYKNAIYFYLHFQYNGWFIFCLLGLFFSLLEKHRCVISKKKVGSFYKLMLWGCILTLPLSFLWIKPHVTIYLIAILGVFIQLFSLNYLYQIIKSHKFVLKQKTTRFFFNLICFVLVFFTLKTLMQSITVIPYFVELSYQIKDFVIGYLHLVFLGVISLSIFFFLHQNKLLKLPKVWISIYLIGFLFSEILIFYKGFCNWQQLSIINNYYTILVLISVLMPIGVLGIFITNIKPTFSNLKESV